MVLATCWDGTGWAFNRVIPAAAMWVDGSSYALAMTSTIDRAQLAKQIAEASLLRGSFTLRSGRQSSYYLDKYLFSTQPRVLAQLGVLFSQTIEEIAREEGSPIDRLAGAELGGIPLVAAASLETNLPSIFVRNAKKTYGTARQLEGRLEPGDRVIIVEDIATTGGQVLEALAVLRDAGANVRAIVCTIDRQEGARANIEAAGVRFEALFTKADLGIDEP